MNRVRFSQWLSVGWLLVLVACQPITRQPEKPVTTIAEQKPVGALTTVSSTIFELPMSVSFSTDWHLSDEFTDLVTVARKQQNWELGFNIVTDAKVTDPVSGAQLPLPEDFVSWIKSNPAFSAEEPTEVMVAGSKGMQLDVTPTTTKKELSLHEWNHLEHDSIPRAMAIHLAQ